VTARVEAPTGEPNAWGADEVQRWFATHKDGKWGKYAHKFAELTGDEMSALSEEAFLRVVEPPYGSAIYNDWRALVGAAAYVAEVAGENVQLFPYGSAAFAAIVRRGSFYADKTRFLRVWEAAGIEKAIFLRPPRSGKSLWLNTMAAYYDINAKPHFEEWFGGLDIGRAPTSLRNSFHVIKFDFGKLVATEDVERTFTDIVNRSARKFIESYKLSVDVNEHNGVDTFDAIVDVMIEANTPLMVLIDEYDRHAVQLLAAQVDPTDPESLYARLVRKSEDGAPPVGPVARLMAAIKGVNSLASFRVFVTGVLETPLAEMSGSNDLRNLTNRPAFAELCHLREEDVARGLDMAGFPASSDAADQRATLLDFIAAFFNGYRFKGSDSALYNPQLVLGFLDDVMTRPELVEQIVSSAWHYRALIDEVDDTNVQLSTTNFNICRHSPFLLSTVLALLDSDVVRAAAPRAVKAVDLVRADNNGVLLELMRQMGMVTFSVDDSGATDSSRLVIPNLMARVHFAEQLLSTVRGCAGEVADFLHDPSAAALERAVTALSEAVWRATDVSADEKHFQAALVAGFWVLALGHPAVVACEESYRSGARGRPPSADIVVRTASATLVLELKRVRGRHLKMFSEKAPRAEVEAHVVAADDANALVEQRLVGYAPGAKTVADVVRAAHEQVRGYVAEEVERGARQPVRGFVVVQVVKPVIVEEVT